MNPEKYIGEPGVDASLQPISLAQQALAIIEKHGLEDYPYECCGFLYGSETEIRFIQEAKPVLNKVSENRRRRFEISPLDYLAAERHAVEKKFNLLGIYHSHPDHPAVPSIHDFRQAVPYFSYIIVSISNGRAEAVRSWQLNDDGYFMEEKINLVNP
jgi:proteasome lid subunit RPN8/RPN11